MIYANAALLSCDTREDLVDQTSECQRCLIAALKTQILQGCYKNVLKVA